MDHVVFHPRRGVQQVPLTTEEIAEREREAEAHAVQAAQQERQRYLLSVQRHIDEVARSRGYDSGVACVSYVSSTNPAWAAEARAFMDWRDEVWRMVYSALEKGGQLDRLPEIQWPQK